MPRGASVDHYDDSIHRGKMAKRQSITANNRQSRLSNPNGALTQQKRASVLAKTIDLNIDDVNEDLVDDIPIYFAQLGEIEVPLNTLSFQLQLLYERFSIIVDYHHHHPEAKYNKKLIKKILPDLSNMILKATAKSTWIREIENRRKQISIIKSTMKSLQEFVRTSDFQLQAMLFDHTSILDVFAGNNPCSSVIILSQDHIT
jgi:hypothetical protein